MAEVTGMRNNALPYPVYGQEWYVTFPLLDADGDPISPSSPDSEVSKNGDTFTDCTNEATEIATSSGSCYLLLTAAEMTADVVTVQIKSTGAKTTVLTLYPRKLPILSSGTCQGSNDTGDIQLASGDSAVDDTYNGCLIVAVIDGTTEARIINDYVGSTKVAEVSPAWNTAQPDSNDTYTIYLPEGRQVPTVNTTFFASTAQTARDIGASVLLSSGTGTGQVSLSSGQVLVQSGTGSGQLSVTSGVIAANVTQWLGTACATPSVAGVPEVDVTHIGGDAQSATDLKDFADAGYDPSTNKVQGVVLTDTLTTYTGNTPQTGDSYARIGSTGSGLTTLATAATLSTVATNVSTIKSAMILAEGTNGSTGNDTTHIHMPALPYGDDEINDHALVIFDDSESEYHVCWITDWVNATKLATVTTLPFTPQNASDSYALLSLKRNVRSDVTAIAIADQVWEETLADHSGTSGSTAAALNAAGSAGDPWSTALPGAYGAGTAGKIIGDNINATVSSRSSHSAADVWAVGTRALTDKAGFTISGTTTTFDALQTALNSAHGSGSWATATGFSTHSAADVWAAASRTLTAGTNIQLPSNGLANVTAWTVAITGNITGNLSGSVGSVTGAVGSVTAGVNLADGAITDAKFTIPTLTSPASGPVGMLVQLWRRFFKKVTRDSDEIKTYADNGSTVVTTQTYTASGSDEDVGAAS